MHKKARSKANAFDLAFFRIFIVFSFYCWLSFGNSIPSIQFSKINCLIVLFLFQKGPSPFQNHSLNASQYLQRYFFLSLSAKTKIWSNSCSQDVIHLGFLHFIIFLISFGSSTWYFSTLTSSFIIFTVILGSKYPNISKPNQ